MISLNQKTNPETNLKNDSSRKIAARVAALSVIAEQPIVVSLPSLKQKPKASRLTLAKTLQTVEIEKPVHKVIDQQHEAHYKTCKLDSAKTNILLHFTCRVCNKLYRLAASTKTRLIIGDGFETHNAILCGVGVCRNCSEKKLSNL